MANRSFVFLALALAPLVAACGGTKVTRMDTAEVKDLSGKWNDTDSRLVAEEMIRDCTSRPWIQSATASIGKAPTVIVGTVRNQSHEHINTDTFVEDLQRELINSGKVEFVASKGERGDVRDERLDQDTNSSEETRKANGKETGADFMLSSDQHGRGPGGRQDGRPVPDQLEAPQHEDEPDRLERAEEDQEVRPTFQGRLVTR